MFSISLESCEVKVSVEEADPFNSPVVATF